MNHRCGWVAAWGLALVMACVPDPKRVSGGGAAGAAGGNPGTIVTRPGTAGAAENPVGPAGATGGDASASGTAGASGDAGTAGASGDAGTSGAAGVSGDAGTGDTAGGSGDAGTGGTADAGVDSVVIPPVDGCLRSSWTFTPSVVCTTACLGMTAANTLPSNAIDGDMSTRYTTGLDEGSKGPETVVLAFAAPVSVTGITLYAKAATDFPNMYLVESSTDGTTFTGFTPPVAGPGSTTLTIPFPGRTTLRAVRVTQTGKSTHWWSINEMNVTGCQSP